MIAESAWAQERQSIVMDDVDSEEFMKERECLTPSERM